MVWTHETLSWVFSPDYLRMCLFPDISRLKTFTDSYITTVPVLETNLSIVRFLDDKSSLIRSMALERRCDHLLPTFALGRNLKNVTKQTIGRCYCVAQMEKPFSRRQYLLSSRSQPSINPKLRCIWYVVSSILCQVIFRIFIWSRPLIYGLSISLWERNFRSK
jgi:hypothetical protein